MSAALVLYRLQQVDSQIDHIQARLKTIREMLENDSALRSATETFAAAQARYKAAERDLKISEAEVEKQRLKIEQAESSLYGGRVQNPKELQDLQMDVASLKRHLVTLENRELEAMAVLETAEQKYQSAQAELEKVRANLSNQHSDLSNEGERLRREIERLNSERKAVMSDLPELAVQTYDELRQRKRGIAVTTISDSACAACGATLTPAQQQSARSAMQFFNCPTCGRILYAN